MTEHADAAAATADDPFPIPEEAPAAGAPAADGPADPYEAMCAVDAEGAAALKAEWGEEFDRNIALACAAAAAFEGSGALDALSEAGIGDDPRVVRVAAEIGRLLEGGVASGVARDARARDALEAELETLVGGADYWSERVQRRVRRIYLELYGSGATPVHRMPGDAAGVE